MNDRKEETNKQMKATNEIEWKSVWFGWEFKIHSKLIDRLAWNSEILSYEYDTYSTSLPTDWTKEKVF